MSKANLNRDYRVRLAGSAAVAVSVIFFVAVNIRASAQLVHPAGGSALSFEVASIRPSRADAGGTNYQISNARFQADNATLTDLIRLAYDIKSDDQLPEAPRWITSQKFDIDAKVDDSDVEAMGKLPPDRKIEQYRLMVRSLLEDRFKLKASISMKERCVVRLKACIRNLIIRPAGICAAGPDRCHLERGRRPTRRMNDLRAGTHSLPQRRR